MLYMNAEKNHQADDILNSLDEMKRANAPDFFYSRLKARMERVLIPAVKRGWLRPAYAFAALALVILINAAVVLTNTSGKNTNDVTANNDNESSSIAAEYNLNDVNSLYDLTLEK